MQRQIDAQAAATQLQIEGLTAQIAALVASRSRPASPNMQRSGHWGIQGQFPGVSPIGAEDKKWVPPSSPEVDSGISTIAMFGETTSTTHVDMEIDLQCTPPPETPAAKSKVGATHQQGPPEMAEAMEVIRLRGKETPAHPSSKGAVKKVLHPYPPNLSGPAPLTSTPTGHQGGNGVTPATPATHSHGIPVASHDNRGQPPPPGSARELEHPERQESPPENPRDRSGNQSWRGNGRGYESDIKLLATFDGKGDWDSFVGPFERMAKKRCWDKDVCLDALYLRLRDNAMSFVIA